MPSQARRAGLHAVATTAVVRGLTLVRAVVVARLLAPDEVGRFLLIVALVGVFEVISNPGIRDALIARNGLTASVLNTGWTMILLRGLVLAVGLWTLAAPLATLVGDEGIARLLRIIAVVPLLRSAQSLAPVLRQRDIDLGPTLRLALLGQFAETLVAVVAAWYLRDALGLVIGSIAGASAVMGASYLVGGHRPRAQVRWREVKSLARYARWRFASGVLVYASTQADNLVVGRLGGAGILGLYGVAQRLAYVPTTELTAALAQVAFPALSRAHAVERDRLGTLYRRYLALSVSLAGAVAAVLFGSADALVFVLLGPVWADAATPLAVIAVAGFVRAVLATGGALFLAAGRPALDTAMQVVRTVTLLLALPLVIPFGALGAAIAALVSVIATVPVWVRGAVRVGVSPRALAGTVLARIPAIFCTLVVSSSLTLLSSPGAMWLAITLCASGLTWLIVVRIMDPGVWAELRPLLRRGI